MAKIMFAVLYGMLFVPRSLCQSGEQCEEEGGRQRCGVVQECALFVELLQRSPLALARHVLLAAQCGFEGRMPKVCCLSPDARASLPNKDNEPTESTKATQGTTEDPEVSRRFPNRFADEDYIDSFPEPPVCGVTHAFFTKVVGGVNAKLGDFPWMALLYYLGEKAQWRCGGSLVSPKHVLTAAHCIHNYEDRLYLVRLGELDLARDDDGAAPVDVLIKSKIKHEDYNSTTYSNDIGLLILQRQVNFTSFIRPICIPAAPELRSNSYVGYHPIIAGWGHTAYKGPSASHLQTLQVPVVSNADCANAFRQHKEYAIDQRVLCAGYEHGGKDACTGDSGGPLMQQIVRTIVLGDDKKHTTYFYQIGLVSFGKQCALRGFPGVYTRVPYFVPWLEKKMLGKA